MLQCESAVEASLRVQVQEKLDKLHARLDTVHHNELTGTVDVTVSLPQWADKSLRYEVLEHLETWEDQCEHAVLTNPTFVVASSIDD